MSLPFEKDAANNKPLPDGLSMADQKAFLLLRELYSQFRHGSITKEQAAEEKKKVIGEHALEKSKEEFLQRNALALNQRISSASEAYRAERTISNADALYAAIYNLPSDWYENTKETHVSSKSSETTDETNK